MSDVESIAYLRVKITALRGYISRTTFNALSDCLNEIKGANDSLKTQLGAVAAERDGLILTVGSLQTEVQMLRSQLESKSIAEADKAIKEAVKDDEYRATEVIADLESGAIEPT